MTTGGTTTTFTTDLAGRLTRKSASVVEDYGFDLQDQLKWVKRGGTLTDESPERHADLAGAPVRPLVPRLNDPADDQLARRQR